MTSPTRTYKTEYAQQEEDEYAKNDSEDDLATHATNQIEDGIIECSIRKNKNGPYTESENH